MRLFTPVFCAAVAVLIALPSDDITLIAGALLLGCVLGGALYKALHDLGYAIFDSGLAAVATLLVAGGGIALLALTGHDYVGWLLAVIGFAAFAYSFVAHFVGPRQTLPQRTFAT